MEPGLATAYHTRSTTIIRSQLHSAAWRSVHRGQPAGDARQRIKEAQRRGWRHPTRGITARSNVGAQKSAKVSNHRRLPTSDVTLMSAQKTLTSANATLTSAFLAPQVGP